MILPSITDEFQGLPRQPIPLRLVPLLLDVSVCEVLRFLAERNIDGGDQMYPALTAYEYRQGVLEAPGSPLAYSALLEESKKLPRLKDQLRLLPADHFVWSDELAQGIQLVKIEHLCTEKEPSELQLHWQVALGPFLDLLAECPEFALADETVESRRIRRKRATKLRHAAYQRRVNELAKQFPGLNHSRICARLAKDLNALSPGSKPVDPETIRRVTKMPE
jgi:hypothetical protein